MQQVKPGRKLIFTGEVNFQAIENLQRDVLKLIDGEPEEWISLYICSEGGFTVAGLAFYDAINHLRPKIQTVALGEVSSIAFVMYLTGIHRAVGKCAKFLIHEESRKFGTESILTLSELKRTIGYMKKEQESYKRILIEKTNGKITKMIEKIIKGEILLSAADALKYGIAHEII